MQLNDLTKDLQRLLLAHWNEKEIQTGLLDDPEYFFDHVVSPRLDYLRRQGEEAPRVRLQKSPAGELRVLLLPR